MKMFDRVKVITNAFEKDGVKNGDIGYIIEIYTDGNCEVEFSMANGISYAQLVINPENLLVLD